MVQKYKLFQLLWRKKEEHPFSVRFGYKEAGCRPDFCYATPGVLVLISSSGARNNDSYHRYVYHRFSGPIDYTFEHHIKQYYETAIKKGELELKEASLNMLLTNENKKIRAFIKGRVQEKFKKLDEFETLYEHEKFQSYLKRWLNGNKKFNPVQFFTEYRKKLYKEAKHLTKTKVITDRIKGERVTITIKVRKWSSQDIMVYDQFDEISEILEIIKSTQVDEFWRRGETGTFEKITDEQIMRIKKISPRVAKEIRKVRDEVRDLLEQANIVTDFQGIDFNRDIQEVVWKK